jgi:hypothetical protein
VNRRFWILLNLALLAALVWAVVTTRDGWLGARAHQAATIGRHPAAPTALPWQPLPTPPAVLPAAYKDVAQKDLLDRSRDPSVPVELPPPPPPPPPVPPLPVYHGYMNIGTGPIAILSVTKTSAHQAISPGDTIGEFTLNSVNTSEIEFQWGTQVIRKSVDELEDNSTPASQPAAVRTEAPPAPAKPPAPPPPPGPGELGSFGVKRCNKGDTSAVGSVVDGYRKVTKATPFGSSCFWEPAQ